MLYTYMYAYFFRPAGHHGKVSSGSHQPVVNFTTHARTKPNKHKMAVLGTLQLSVLFHTGVLVIAGTILLCYVLAVSLRHVPVWLPMISDCQVFPPEKYFSRWGILVGAALLGAQNVLIYGANKSYSKSKASLVLGLVAAFCLSVVAVVNEAENNTIHSGKPKFRLLCVSVATVSRVSWECLCTFCILRFFPLMQHNTLFRCSCYLLLCI